MSSNSPNSNLVPDEWLTAYLDGELNPQERSQVEQALAQEPGLRGLLDELRVTSQAAGQLPVFPNSRLQLALSSQIPELEDGLDDPLLSPSQPPAAQQVRQRSISRSSRQESHRSPRSSSRTLPWHWLALASSLIGVGIVGAMLWLPKDQTLLSQADPSLLVPPGEIHLLESKSSSSPMVATGDTDGPLSALHENELASSPATIGSANAKTGEEHLGVALSLGSSQAGTIDNTPRSNGPTNSARSPGLPHLSNLPEGAASGDSLALDPNATSPDSSLDSLPLDSLARRFPNARDVNTDGMEAGALSPQEFAPGQPAANVEIATSPIPPSFADISANSTSPESALQNALSPTTTPNALSPTTPSNSPTLPPTTPAATSMQTKEQLSEAVTEHIRGLPKPFNDSNMMAPIPSRRDPNSAASSRSSLAPSAPQGPTSTSAAAEGPQNPGRSQFRQQGQTGEAASSQRLLENRQSASARGTMRTRLRSTVHQTDTVDEASVLNQWNTNLLLRSLGSTLAGPKASQLKQPLHQLADAGGPVPIAVITPSSGESHQRLLDQVRSLQLRPALPEDSHQLAVILFLTDNQLGELIRASQIREPEELYWIQPTSLPDSNQLRIVVINVPST